MSIEEEILDSLSICENLPDYGNYDQVFSDLKNLSDELKPEEFVEQPVEQAVDQVSETPDIYTEPEEPSVPIAVSSANVKYDEVTRPIPTIKGVPIVSPPVEQPKIEPVTQTVTQTEQIDQPELVFSKTTESDSEPDFVQIPDAEVAPEENEQTIEAEPINDMVSVVRAASPLEQTNPSSDSNTENEIDDSTEKEGSKKSELVKGIISILICVAVAFGIAFVITHFVAHHTQVEGSSMEPNLHDGDEIIVEKLSYYFSDPERYDIIVFPYSDQVYYIKRIIGLPGETIQIKNGKIYVDGVQLWEQYGNQAIQDPGLAKEEIVLGKNEYFVLGDNRNSSIDSRKSEVGVIKRNKIVGKAWLRFYPFSDFGVLKHQ